MQYLYLLCDNMNFEYDLKNNVLCIDENHYSAYDIENNEVGICSSCGANLLSMSYHTFNESLIIVSKCGNCELIYANIYDNNWVWMNEVVISHFLDDVCNNDVKCNSTECESNKNINEKLQSLNNIPMKQLTTIFSSAEITAIFARAKGDECVRQYLYNARKKYDKFEDVFGIKIDV